MEELTSHVLVHWMYNKVHVCNSPSSDSHLNARYYILVQILIVIQKLWTYLGSSDSHLMYVFTKLTIHACFWHTKLPYQLIFLIEILNYEYQSNQGITRHSINSRKEAYKNAQYVPLSKYHIVVLKIYINYMYNYKEKKTHTHTYI